jgi:large subunit ribosomal protein L15
MKLHTLKPAQGSVKTNKRLGRGEGSGMGGTATRGHKGAKSRSGYSRKIGFEGGQMPLQRRVPKYGFKNPNRVAYKGINLDTLQELAQKINSTSIDLEVLKSNGLISKNDLVKVLGRGEVKVALSVSVHAFSATAKAAIENAGGKTTEISLVAKKVIE